MANSCAIYAPIDYQLPQNPFGKDVANLGLYRGLLRHSGLEEICFLVHNQATPEQIQRHLLAGQPSPSRISVANLFNADRIAKAGALLRGKADLADLAWLRRRTLGDKAYSLVGLVHCIAPPAMRQYIAASTTAPVQPWDALICTSPVVRDALGDMFEQWGAYLADRFGGTKCPKPMLPLIPLAVEEGQIATAEAPGRRGELRERLGVAESDTLVLWVGRLSFFEKAFPQPMFLAVEEAARATGRNFHFAMAGWFPNGEAGRKLYEEAARHHAPSVRMHFLDGNDRQLVDGMWKALDIFLSLVDNIQETFGITPLEPMAAGLPIVASDWDGYRYTIEHGRQGFLIPTLGGPPGAGHLMMSRHVLGLDSYQRYAGTVAQHTAVNVPLAARALARLAEDPELRRSMGESGKARIRSTFSWTVVAKQIAELLEELAQIRAREEGFESATGKRQISDPVKAEPFAAFAEFATDVLGGESVLEVGRDLAPEDLARSFALELDAYANPWRSDLKESQALLDLLRSNGPSELNRILQRFPAPTHPRIRLAVMWMCKLGLLDWKASAP